VARRYRIPGIIDLTFVDETREVRALSDAPALDRRFERRGPLVNRLIAGRIRRWLRINAKPLPALAPREDAARAERQKSLRAALDPGAGQPLWTEAQIDRLAGYLRGRLTREEAGIAVQEIIGQRFDAAYVADRASWEAAEMIDDFRDRFASPRHLLWLITGRLRRARALLLERAGHDPHAMHGTAIGVHGIVDALERMRELRARPGVDSIDAAVAVGRCLRGPRRVLRTVETTLATPATTAPLRASSMVMFELEEAGMHAPDPEMIFMHGHWSFCPAEVFIPALLQAAWRKAA
jgi:hypothetical protein